MRPCISITGFVCPSVCRSLHPRVTLSSKTGKSMILIANNDVSCNLIIIQSFHHYEDASLAVWALFIAEVATFMRLLVCHSISHTLMKNEQNCTSVLRSKSNVINPCPCVFMHVHTPLCMSLRMCVGLYGCSYAHVRVRMRSCVFIRARSFPYARGRVRTSTVVSVRFRACRHAPMRVRTHACVSVRAHTCPYTRVRVRTRAYVSIHTRTYL